MIVDWKYLRFVLFTTIITRIQFILHRNSLSVQSFRNKASRIVKWYSALRVHRLS